MSTQYWEEELETMSREKLQELQLQRLKKTINIAANAPYYKDVFSNMASQQIAYSHWMISAKYLSLPSLTCAPTTRSDWWQVI